MDEDEKAFLSGILENPLDNAIRLIYSDWLEEHDRPIQADYLRVECQMSAFQPEDIRYKLKRAYLITIGKSLDSEWVALISRVKIDNCPSHQNPNSNCPNQWEALKITECERIRECEQCRRRVYFCSEVLEVDRLRRQGEVIVIDPRLQYGGNSPKPRSPRRDRFRK